jgi:hypothetical protein
MEIKICQIRCKVHYGVHPDLHKPGKFGGDGTNKSLKVKQARQAAVEHHCCLPCVTIRPLRAHDRALAELGSQGWASVAAHQGFKLDN